MANQDLPTYPSTVVGGEFARHRRIGVHIPAYSQAIFCLRPGLYVVYVSL